MSKARPKTLFSIACLALLAIAFFAGCQPEVTEKDNSDSDEALRFDFVWSKDGDCSVCHTVESDSAAVAECLAGQHASIGYDCISCHSDESGLKEAHSDVVAGETRAPKRLKATEVTEETCLSCHGSREEIAVATADFAGIVDKNGTVINPHEVPQTESHAGLICTDCHLVHDAAKAELAALSSCFTCHHAKVFECNTCH